MTAITIGMIFECGPMGADKAVCEYLASQLRPGVNFSSRTMDNKPNLIADAAKVAGALLQDGCERVLIVWDLRPAWPDKTKKACRAEERNALLTSLTKEGLSGRPVYLICIEQELESWLLADENKISNFLSTPAREYPVKRVKRPDQVMQPKAVIMNHFNTARGWRYEDRVNAIKLVRCGATNWSRLRQSESFVRFEVKLTT